MVSSSLSCSDTQSSTRGSFKRSVAIALSWAAIPQLLIPYVGNWYLVVALRFIQGFVVSLVPLFSTQIARFFVAERPFAKGIILSGIFWGGVFGSISARYLVEAVGWKMGFVVTAIIMYAVLLLWWLLVEDFEIIPEKTGSDVNIWKMPFTWVLGLTFFPALWVIFTIVGFSASLGYDLGWTKDQVSNLSTTLNVSKALWSIAMGFVGFQLSKKNTTPRGLFKAIVQVMMISYTIAFIGLILYSKAMLAGNYAMALASVVLVGALQGTGGRLSGRVPPPPLIQSASIQKLRSPLAHLKLCKRHSSIGHRSPGFHQREARPC